MRILYCFLGSLLLLWPSIHFAGSGMSRFSKDSSSKTKSEETCAKAKLEATDLYSKLHHEVCANNHAKVAKLLQTIDKTVAAQYKESIDLDCMIKARDVPMAQLLVQAGFRDFNGENGYRLLKRVVYASRHDQALIGYYVQQGADPNYCIAGRFCWGNTILESLCSSALDITMDTDWCICSNHEDTSGIKESGSVGDITDKACELVRHGAQLNVGFNGPSLLKKYFFGHTCCRVNGRSSEENTWQDKHAKKLLVLRTQLMNVWDTVIIPRAKAMKAQVYAALIDTQNQPICDIIAAYVCAQETYLELENEEQYVTDAKGNKKLSVLFPTATCKPCEHGDRCTGPCKEVFEAFGLQKPDPEKYRALKNSKFAPATVEVVHE